MISLEQGRDSVSVYAENKELEKLKEDKEKMIEHHQSHKERQGNLPAKVSWRRQTKGSEGLELR